WLFGIELAGKSRRVDQVTKEHGELTAFRLGARWSRKGASGSWCILNGTGCFLLEHRRGTFRSWTHIPEPHEATALLTHWMVGIEEFCWKLGKGPLGKCELAL